MYKRNSKILLISSNSSGRGGGERYLQYLAQGLMEIGCKVEVLLSSATYMDELSFNMNNLGALVHRRKLIGLSDRPLRFIQAVLDVKQQKVIKDVCKEVNPDLIVVNRQYDEDGLDYIMGCVACGLCPVVGVLHMPMTKNKNKRFLGSFRGFLIKYWHKLNPHIMLFSSYDSKSEFFSYYGIAMESVVIHSGIIFQNETSYTLGYQRYGVGGIVESDGEKREIVIGFVGQFVHQKNIMMIIDGWIASKVRSKLLLVGDGPMRKDIESRLKGVNLPWQITGWSSKYREFITEIDLLIMPSHFESLPLALIESTGMGVPAIVSNFNGAKEIAHYAPWITVLDNSSIDELAKAIRLKDVNLLVDKRVAASNKCKFQHYFSIERMAMELLRKINQIS